MDCCIWSDTFLWDSNAISYIGRYFSYWSIGTSMPMKITINEKEVTEDDLFMQVMIGSDLRDMPAISLMLKNPAGFAKLELFHDTTPYPGGYLNKAQAIKIRDFLIETIKLCGEYEEKSSD